MPLSALPKHLNRYPAGDGTDWDNPVQRLWDRAWFAFGPNAVDGDWGRITLLPIPWTRYRLATPFKLPGRWRRFPALLFGYNVVRWMSKDDKSIVCLPGMRNKFVLFGHIYFKGHGFVRMSDSFCRFFTIETNAFPARPAIYLAGNELVESYGPSPLQQFQPTFSFQVTWPLFFAVQFGGTPKKGNAYAYFDPKFYFRFLCRWASGDDMYDVPSIFLGGTSN